MYKNITSHISHCFIVGLKLYLCSANFVVENKNIFEFA